MYDRDLLIDQLGQRLKALERIPRRFSNVTTATDFLDSTAGEDRLDSICMILIAVGEALRFQGPDEGCAHHVRMTDPQGAGGSDRKKRLNCSRASVYRVVNALERFLGAPIVHERDKGFR